MNHLLSILDLTKHQIIDYIARAEQFKKENAFYTNMNNRILVNLFYEPSTRTSCSFQTAMIKLGGHVINVTDKYSSVEKGESLEDTIKTLCCYADIIAIRHPQKGSVQTASLASSVPLINAGDGNGEHPTQALLDIFTIKTELMKYNLDITSNNRDRENIVITFVGDLKNSRTIHSLIHILYLFSKVSFHFICPKGLEVPTEIINILNERTMKFTTHLSLEEALKTTDVLYVTRIQKERFQSNEEYKSIVETEQDKYVITRSILHQYAKEKMIIMHPLPRLNEIEPEIDNDPRAVYFEQVKNGVYMRMAILENLLS
jgi:carbamoyl-phosphate synthase/aspartate carbamoyltransferase